MRGRSRTRGRLGRWPWRLETGGISCPHDFESPSSEAFPGTPSLDSLSDTPATPVFDDLSRTRALTGSNQARLTKSVLSAPTRAVLPQFTRPAVSSGLGRTQHRLNGTRHSNDCPKARRERQCSLRSKCGSVAVIDAPKSLNTRYAFFLASSAPESAVTGPRSTLLQATCVPTAISTNKSREHPTAQPFFLGCEAAANAPASRAQDTCHEFMTFSSSSYRSGVRESKWRDCGFHEHVD